MTTSAPHLQHFAALLLENEGAVEDLRTRIQQRLFEKFRKASPAEREIINAIMDNENLFWTELRIILGESEEVNEESQDEKTN